jgi:hypothetical protein
MTLSRLTIIEWDGANLPPELSALPPGRYLVEPVDPTDGDEILDSDLTDEEEQGIIDALAELDAGGGIPFDDVMRDLKRRWAQR